MALVVKNPPANAGVIKGAGSIPAPGRSPGGGHGNPLQFSLLENPMDRGAWWATVHMVTKSQPQLKRLNTHTHTHTQWLPMGKGERQYASSGLKGTNYSV